MLNRNRTNTSSTTTGNKASAPKEKYVLGNSECHYEVASYLVGKLTVKKVVALFNNENMYLAETEGRSLKVMFKAKEEIKFLGFITAGDASLDLTEEDIPQILEQAHISIVRAISVDELINLF